MKIGERIRWLSDAVLMPLGVIMGKMIDEKWDSVLVYDPTELERVDVYINISLCVRAAQAALFEEKPSARFRMSLEEIETMTAKVADEIAKSIIQHFHDMGYQLEWKIDRLAEGPAMPHPEYILVGEAWQEKGKNAPTEQS